MSEREQVDRLLEPDLVHLQGAWVRLDGRAVAKEINVRGIVANRHVRRQVDRSAKQAAADKGHAAVVLLEQHLPLFEVDHRRAEALFVGIVRAAPPKIEITEAD